MMYFENKFIDIIELKKIMEKKQLEKYKKRIESLIENISDQIELVVEWNRTFITMSMYKDEINEIKPLLEEKGYLIQKLEDYSTNDPQKSDIYKISWGDKE